MSSLSHLGGNTTGISILATELDSKRQELLIELVLEARRMAALADPNAIAPEQLRALQDASQMQGIELSTHIASTDSRGDHFRARYGKDRRCSSAQCLGVRIIQRQQPADN